MKLTIEQELLAIRTRRQPNVAFVLGTMRAVRSQAAHNAFEQNLKNTDRSLHVSLFTKLKRLPAAIAIALILLTAVSLGSAVYALVRYVPNLVKITSSATTPRGTKEYWAPAFAGCTSNGTRKFERNKDAAQLSDADVQKLIKARCEENVIESFPSHAWPTYGTHKVWKNGDTIYYARPDAIGTLQTASATSITVNESATSSQLKTYKVQPGQQITVYYDGVKVPLSSLHANDSVRIITRVSEVYTKPQRLDPSLSIQYTQPANHSQPVVVGVIGIIKLSQPLQYYGSMQNDLTELPPCIGNAGEYCPSTASIDVYPREGGEGATNPSLVDPDPSRNREISGIVTVLNSATLKLKSSSGKIYTVNVPSNGFADYNIHYAPGYGDDATLRVGTTISVLYNVPAGKSAQVIAPSQIINVRLLLDGDVKQGSAKQY